MHDKDSEVAASEDTSKQLKFSVDWILSKGNNKSEIGKLTDQNEQVECCFAD